MTTSDQELLKQFVGHRSEVAFATLLQRYLPLVHGTAWRQLEGQNALVEDIAQCVFLDLARKASSLSDRVQLSGWLYTATCFQIKLHKRTERRRVQREAWAISTSIDTTKHSTPNLEELKRFLDDAMLELNSKDREVLLDRFFECRPLAEVGRRLGLGEDAARMRIERALERLRRKLSRRGIASTAAALSAAMAETTGSVVPNGLSARIQGLFVLEASRSVVVHPGQRLWIVLVSAIIRLLSNTKATVAGVALFILFGVVWDRTSGMRQGNHSAVSPAGGPLSDAASVITPPMAERSTNVARGIASDSLEGQRLLLLKIESADQQKPMGLVEIRQTVEWEVDDGKKTQNWVLHSLRDGTCTIVYSSNATGLQLVLRADGYASTRLAWTRQYGEHIPDNYTARLVRPVRLAGFVFDPDGNPLADAVVQFQSAESWPNMPQPESHQFGYLHTTTDGTGHWEMAEIAEDFLPYTSVRAEHPQYRSSTTFTLGQNLHAMGEMRAGTYVFRLGGTENILGRVIDQSSHPIAGATVRLGWVFESESRVTTSNADGQFLFEDCPMSENILTAGFRGMAPISRKVDLRSQSGPFELVLVAGRTLIFNVVDRDQKPLSNVTARFDASGNFLPPGSQRDSVPQTMIELKSDSDGKIVWENAPDAELVFRFEADGYMRRLNAPVRPDDQVHTVVLSPALSIYGSVTEAETGKPVPRFQILSGVPLDSPTTESKVGADWGTLPRFNVAGSNGAYRQTYNESLTEPVNRGYVLKFVADGYAPFVSRLILPDEGEVRLDAQLKAATATTLTVVSPSGQPLPGAQVAVLLAGGTVQLKKGRLELMELRGGSLLITDGQGQVSIPTDRSVASLIAIAPQGFSMRHPAELIDQTVWGLQEWGGIRGTLRRGNQPVAAATVGLWMAVGDDQTMQLNPESFRTVTRNNGEFEISGVPPGAWQLSRHLLSTNDGGFQLLGQPTNIFIEPGRVTSVNWVASGLIVTARLQFPNDADPLGGWKVSGELQSPSPIPPDAIAHDSEALAVWSRSPAVMNAISNMRFFGFAPQPDGSFLADSVESGSYTVRFEAEALSSDSTGSQRGNSGQRMVGLLPTVTLSSELGLEDIDLGVIRMVPEGQK